jgi:hypothetical protein
LDAPAVKGLVIYGARCGTLKFFAAWVEWSGTFIGWLKVQPAVEGVDSDFGVGEVLGRPLFLGITMDLNGHMAVDRFVQGSGKLPGIWALLVDERVRRRRSAGTGSHPL